MIVLKTLKQIDTINEANIIVHKALNEAKLHLYPGISTQLINDIILSVIHDCGGKPAFKGYMGFPESSCISINKEVVHGIPSVDVIINDGDVVSIDVGVSYDGFIGDAAITVAVGDVSDEILNLIENTKHALYEGISFAINNGRLHDISSAIEDVAKENKYGNIREYCGHGVGKKLHEEPKVFNYVDYKQPNIKLRTGMTLAIEPMFTLGSGKTSVLSDGWTVVTDDVAAHWEVSIAITDDGPRILGLE